MAEDDLYNMARLVDDDNPSGLIKLIRAVIAQDIAAAVTKVLGRREPPGNVLLQYADEHGADEHGATISADEPAFDPTACEGNHPAGQCYARICIRRDTFVPDEPPAPNPTQPHTRKDG